MGFGEAARNLERNGFVVSSFATGEEAVAYLDGQIDATTVGFGGSTTLAELGLYEALATHNQVFWHNRPGVDMNAERAGASTAEAYVCSVNALAATGELVNIDANGNRVAATYYGHGRLYFVVGRNKLAPSLEEAVWRARNVAAPLNARRMKCDTPCATGELRCHDCQSPQRICRGLSIHLQPVRGIGRTEVLLVDQDLGF